MTEIGSAIYTIYGHALNISEYDHHEPGLHHWKTMLHSVPYYLSIWVTSSGPRVTPGTNRSRSLVTRVYFTEEVNSNLANPPMNLNGELANFGFAINKLGF